MDPLITNRLDPALLRVIEKRGGDQDAPTKRRRTAPPEKPAEEENADQASHELDDLA